jgi:peptidoglycan/xylan/chitin deacetylase (PgdA/CDA1 family)
MDRRTFMTSTTAAAIGLGANAILPKLAQGKETMDTPTQSFWPDKARLVISVSMQFETGSQPDRGAGSPFPPLDPKYPDLPVGKWYEYGFKEGVPRLLDMWDRVGVKVTSHMVGQAVERHPELAKEIVDRGHEASGHGQIWEPEYSMTPEQERAAYQASIDTIQRVTGTRPVGFNAFWLRGTPNTLGILQDLGFIYHIDDISRERAVYGDGERQTLCRRVLYDS